MLLRKLIFQYTFTIRKHNFGDNWKAPLQPGFRGWWETAVVLGCCLQVLDRMQIEIYSITLDLHLITCFAPSD